MWYTQKDGFAMGASLAVILASLWIKEFELVLRKEFPELCKPIENLQGICPECWKKVRYRQRCRM